ARGRGGGEGGGGEGAAAGAWGGTGGGGGAGGRGGCRAVGFPPPAGGGAAPPGGGKEGAPPAVVADGHPRPRAGDARGPGADPVEPTHGPARGGPRRDGREAELVRPALEVGDLSQGPEVGLPGRAGPATDGRAADQPVGCAVRRPLASR